MSLIFVPIVLFIAWAIIASAVRNGIKTALRNHEDLIHKAIRNAVRDALEGHEAARPSGSDS